MYVCKLEVPWNGKTGLLLQAIGFEGLYVFDGQYIFFPRLVNVALVFILLIVRDSDRKGLRQDIRCNQLRARVMGNTAFQSI
jgi:hypothetical protein